MKKFITPLFALIVAASCQAQENHLDKFYQKFDNEGSETVKGSINLALLMNFGDHDSSDGWMKKVTMCRFLTFDQEKTTKASEEWSELAQVLKEDHFEELMTVRKGKGNLRLLEKERKDGQEDIVCLAAGEHGGGVFFHVRGRFTAADKARIQAALQDRES
jgi:hypothetical protein